MEYCFIFLFFDFFMCSSDEKQSCSLLVFYFEYQCMDIELCLLYVMFISYWYGQVEVNVLFDGDVEYLINNEVVCIEKGYIILFWVCMLYQLICFGDCQQMVIFNLLMYLFFLWLLDWEFINYVIYGMVIKFFVVQQLSVFEVCCWQQELSYENEQICQLVIDEIVLMLKWLSFVGWQLILVNKILCIYKNSVLCYVQFYVSQMLEFIVVYYDQVLIVNVVVEYVKFNLNYVMGVFQWVMQQIMKQYIIVMCINYVWVLLSDIDKIILDIVFIVGFCFSSCFYSIFICYVGMLLQQYCKFSQQWCYGLVLLEV